MPNNVALKRVATALNGFAGLSGTPGTKVEPSGEDEGVHRPA